MSRSEQIQEAIQNVKSWQQSVGDALIMRDHPLALDIIGHAESLGVKETTLGTLRRMVTRSMGKK